MTKNLTSQEFIARHFLGSALNAGQIAKRDPFLSATDRSSVSTAANDLFSPTGRIALRLVGAASQHANIGQRFGFTVPGSFVGVGLVNDLKGDQAGKEVLTYDIDITHPWSKFITNLAVASARGYSTTEGILRTIEYPFVRTVLNVLGNYLGSYDGLLTRAEFASYSRQYAKGIEI